MTLTVLADPVQVVQVAAHIVPQPGPSPIEHNAVLFTIVVVRLIFAPSWTHYHITWKKVRNKQMCRIITSINLSSTGDHLKCFRLRRLRHLKIPTNIPSTHFQVLDVSPGSFCAPIHTSCVLSCDLRRSSSWIRKLDVAP